MALVKSSLGAVSQPKAEQSLAWGTGGVDVQVEQGTWMDLRGGQRRSSSQKTPGRSWQPGARRVCGLIPEATEAVGLSHECAKLR